jgi:uncharacterized protein (DUF924 family)
LSQDKPWAELIDGWFGDTLDDPSAIPQRMGWWFSADEERDSGLASRYGELVEQCAIGRHYRWLDDPEGRLALVLALDQLPRNLFRGTPRAFAYDASTAAWCLAAAHTGQDKALKPIQRAFLYMPLQHMEDLQAQQAGVALFERLAEDMAPLEYYREGFLPFARQHLEIIARFGRFPHRNQVLGRTNTPEEDEYLAGGAPTFGQ